MTSITLILQTASGDEFDRVQLPEVLVETSPGTCDSARPRSTYADLAAVARRIDVALRAQQLTPSLDLVGLQIALSRALLSGAADSVQVLVPVVPTTPCEIQANNLSRDAHEILLPSDLFDLRLEEDCDDAF